MEKKSGNKIQVGIVVPAYNEGGKIFPLLVTLLKSYENVYVVDDGSIDQTAEYAAKSGAFVLRHLINRGQGAALRTGTNFAISQGCDTIVHFDADGQFAINDIDGVLGKLQSTGADIVFGSRFLGKESPEMPWTKKNLIMPLARFINQTCFGIKTTDPQSGFRAFTSSAAQKLRWQQDRFAHCSEILYQAHKIGLHIEEYPIQVRYDRYGQNLGGGIRILKDLFIGSLINF